MTSLLNRAKELDKANGLTDEAMYMKKARLSEYRRNLARLNALMLRTLDNPPSELDERHLQNFLWHFRKK